MKAINLTTACETVNLKKIRSFVLGKLDSFQLAQQDANLIVLAIDEVCANIMIHSNSCNKEKELTLCLTKDHDQLVIEVYDHGQSFNPIHYHEPDLKEVVENRKKGGIGMMLVRRIMDSVEYEKLDNRNVCRMRKALEQ